MSDQFQIFFHLGYSKVASTWFQRIVFPALKGVIFHKKHHFKHHKQLLNHNPAGTHLFSTEKDKRIIQAAEEIGKLYPDAGFIVFLRRQDDWLLSRYKYRIRKHGRESFGEFFDLENDQGLWKKETLYYRKVIEEFEKSSSRKPLFMTYDQLRENPGIFIKQLTDYLQTSINPNAMTRHPRNVSFSEKQLIILRKWNRLFPYRNEISRVKMVNKMHQKFRDLLLHIVAALASGMPKGLVKEKSLLSDEELKSLKKIREFYREDWEFCEKYAAF